MADTEYFPMELGIQNNKEVIMKNKKNDWRLSRDQIKYLKDEKLLNISFEKWSETWDHEHCEFCWAKFSEFDGDLKKGYCTLDKKKWICNECFNDFKEMFNWKTAKQDNK